VVSQREAYLVKGKLKNLAKHCCNLKHLEKRQYIHIQNIKCELLFKIYKQLHRSHELHIKYIKGLYEIEVQTLDMPIPSPYMTITIQVHTLHQIYVGPYEFYIVQYS